MSTSSYNMSPSVHHDQNTTRKPRACVPCHERKVKCNASVTGLPCTRCLGRGREAACELVPLPQRSNAHKARPRKTIEDHIDQEQRGLPVFVGHQGSDSSTSSAVQAPEKMGRVSHKGGIGIVPQGPGWSLPATCTTSTLCEPPSGLKAQDYRTVEVAEEDCQLETCLRMAQTEDNRPDLPSETQTSQAREVFAYHGGVDSTTILGQLLSHKNPRRFVRIKLREPHEFGDNTRGNLDPKSMEYLQSVEALTIPPSTIRRKLIQIYFERVYPYVPVLNRLSFMRKVRDGKCSIFLLQCIFTSVTPYVSHELLNALAYSERAQAQRAFFSKAQLLYDLGAERSQLCLLQGSLILTSTYFSFGLDKDCRFWLTNAVRIATQMGLHRRQIMDQLDRDTVKLVKRIFWVMYSRDVIMVMSGRLNVRALDDRYCDLPEVTKEDWEDEPEQDLAQHKLEPIPSLQKSHLVHSVRLARISGQYIDSFRRPNAPATEIACEDIETKLASWRRSLPPELQPETVKEWSQENVWILVLRAMRYRLECLLYRDIREIPSLEQDVKGRALQKRRNAMLELDSIFHRIMLHDLVEFCPFSMTTCASTVIAMQIECALSPGSTDTQRQLSRTSIHAGLAYLRACLEYWDSVRWSLRLLDAMVFRSRLSLTTPENQPTSLPSLPSRPSEAITAMNGTTLPGRQNCTAPEATNSMMVPSKNDRTWNSLLRYPTTAVTEHGFSYESMCLDTDLEEDFDDIFLEDFYGANPMQAWEYGGI